MRRWWQWDLGGGAADEMAWGLAGEAAAAAAAAARLIR